MQPQVIQAISEHYGVPVTEIEKYEGLLATLEARRDRLSKRWARKVRACPRAIAKGFDTTGFVASVHQQLVAAGVGPSDNDAGSPPGPLQVLRRDAAKGLAIVWLRVWLQENPGTEREWTALVSQAEAEAAAEGVTQATALLKDSGHIPAGVDLDLDQLYDDTLAQRRCRQESPPGQSASRL